MALVGPSAAQPSAAQPASDALAPQLGNGGWFRNRRYDLTLTVGVFALAVILGGIGLISRACFLWVILADVWLLAYPHVTAMYTRIAFDRKSRARYWFLLTILPVVVLLGTATTAWLGGAVALFSVYYFWQTWHYTRQSYGIARAMTRASDALRESSAPAPDRNYPLPWSSIPCRWRDCSTAAPSSHRRSTTTPS